MPSSSISELVRGLAHSENQSEWIRLNYEILNYEI